MPGVSTNVEIWSLKPNTVSLFSCPRPCSRSRGAESEEVPEDAEVVGETWQHVKADSSRDIRYPNNPRYPVVLYGLLSVTGTEPGLRLLVSNKAAAVRFARAFGSGRGEERPQ